MFLDPCKDFWSQGYKNHLGALQVTGLYTFVFLRAPQWYTAVVLSQLMSATLPVCPQVKYLRL